MSICDTAVTEPVTVYVHEAAKPVAFVAKLTIWHILCLFGIIGTICRTA